MQKKYRVLIFIVAYNAERFISRVLERIPDQVAANPDLACEVLVIDDSSPDATFAAAKAYKDANPRPGLPLTVMRNPVNLGYGGNQKHGYHYALENGFDAVALLHGDGQYAPELLPQMLAPLRDGSADFVIGSRMLSKGRALRGGMPLYKFLGNIVLTRLQNALLGSRLAEFHSGYRAYSTAALKRIPFELNANGFDFDTDILIQLLDQGQRCREIDIPTYYGDEICHVNGMRYALDILRSTLLSRLQKYAIYYHPKFDYSRWPAYTSKLDFDSSHSAVARRVRPDSTVLDVGCGSGFVAQALAHKGCQVYGIDFAISPEHKQFFAGWREADINQDDLEFGLPRVDYILLLDIVEHLEDPEAFFFRLRRQFARHAPRVIISSGNVAFLPMRLSLLLGQFNYGKRGILDLTHKRLFTFSSMLRVLRACGYRVEQVEGIPLPFALILGNNGLSRFLARVNRALIRLSKGLFAYQLCVEATPQPTVPDLLDSADKH